MHNRAKTPESSTTPHFNRLTPMPLNISAYPLSNLPLTPSVPDVVTYTTLVGAYRAVRSAAVMCWCSLVGVHLLQTRFSLVAQQLVIPTL